MYSTKINLKDEVRQKIIELFQERLSDGLDLMLQTKHAHWNLKGEQFISLHRLCDKVNKAMRKSSDLIAERIVQLGGVAHGTSQSITKKTSIDEYPSNIADWKEHIEFLSNSLAQFCNESRAALKQFDKIDDPVSEDILIEVTRKVDMYLWMLESHLFRAKAGEQDLSEVA